MKTPTLEQLVAAARKAGAVVTVGLAPLDIKNQLAEAEKSSDHYEAKCGELQRKINQLEKSWAEQSSIMASEIAWASYAKDCPRCKKKASKVRA